MTLTLITLTLSCGFLALTAAADAAQPTGDPQEARHFEKSIKKTVTLNYLLYLPEDYGKDKNKQWPMIMFLHGVGERGSDPNKLKVTGPPMMIAQGKKFPFIMVSPQCPDDSWWDKETDALTALLDEIESKYKVDKNRVYLTGLSMGGFGTWSLAIAQPKRFAAIAPICGGGETRRAPLLKDVPIWAFHGDKDSVVPVSRTIEMIDAIKAAGGSPKVTIYPGVNHDSWTQTYNNDDFWKWLLDQHKK